LIAATRAANNFCAAKYPFSPLIMLDFFAATAEFAAKLAVGVVA
jgi:hypothetical protein